MTKLNDLIEHVCEHALTTSVGIGDKVSVQTGSIQRHGIVMYISKHADIITVKFPGENDTETFYADQAHLIKKLKEDVLDVIARDKTFPFHRYFHKKNNKVILISCEPLKGRNWKRIENVIGSEDDFVDQVRAGKIQNVDFTRPLGKEKEDVKSLQRTKESVGSEIGELDRMCKNMLSIDKEFADYLLEHGIGPEQFGDLDNSMYTNFLLKMKEEIRRRGRKQ